MWTITNFLLFSFVAVIAHGYVALEPDRPYLRLPINDEAVLECCYKTSKDQPETHIWYKNNQTIMGDTTVKEKETPGTYCGTLTLKSIQKDDTGLYKCLLSESRLHTHGTVLHVYQPLVKTINLSESTKNKILTAEGILLFLCVILPASTLLFQAKRLNELEKKKVRKEEENIYQGLNLDDCCATYDQIERSQAPSQYQDVCNTLEEQEEEIQLEKP